MDRDRQGQKEQSLGRFCNTYLPLPVLLSSWNGLRVILQTDGTRNAGGFRAQYEAMDYKYAGDEDLNNTDCKFVIALLPSGSEEGRVLGVGSISVAILSSCQ